MNFGELEIATLWRVWKDGVCRRAAMLERGRGARLVVLESERIVQWETFAGAAELRDRAARLYVELKKSGWNPVSRDIPVLNLWSLPRGRGRRRSAGQRRFALLDTN